MLGPTIDFRHQKDLGAGTVSKGFAHANLAVAVVVVPAVIHKGNSLIDRAADEFDTVRFRQLWFADVVSSQTDDGHFLFGAAKGAIQHVASPDFH